MAAVDPASDGPLAGLVVIDLSTTLPGAQATQFLADCGAEVIMVEPPDGSPLRELASWPALLRGKRSVTLDLHADADLDRLHAVLRRADVMVNTMRPTTAERLGLSAESLSQRYPRLVVANVTGWGSTGPFRNYKGWEALVMAKTGVMHEKRGLALRPGPAFITAAYASWGAAHAAVQGVLAALFEREASGLGQVVETNMVTGMGSMDPYNWFYEMVLERYPGAFEPMDAAYDDQGRPQAYLIYALLVCPTKDGRWLQFAQVSPKLIGAWLTELDLLGSSPTRSGRAFRCCRPRTAHRVVGHDDRAGGGPHARRMAAGHDRESRPERRTVPNSRGVAGSPADHSRRPRRRRDRSRSRAGAAAVDPDSRRRQAVDPLRPARESASTTARSTSSRSAKCAGPRYPHGKGITTRHR